MFDMDHRSACARGRMLPHAFLGLLLCLVALWALTGCSVGLAPQPAAHTPTTPVARATTTPAPPAAVPLQAAWGDVAITRLPTDLGDNRVFVFENAATPDGQWLVGVSEPRDFITNTSRLSYLSLYNTRTRQIVRLRALLHPQSQLLGASIDDHWLVWSEASDQPNFFDWTMFAYNRDTGQVTELARAPRVGEQPAPGPNSSPVVDQGHVIWSQPLAPVTPGNDASLNNIVVRLEDLATGQVTTLATRAGESTLSWPWAAWAQITTLTNGVSGHVTLRNLVTGQEVQLRQKPATIVLSSGSVAYDDTTSVYLIDDITRGEASALRVATAANEAEHLEFVTLNDRLVAWNQQSAQPPVWDRLQRRMVLLPVSQGLSDGWVGGRTLLWFDPEPQTQQDQDRRNGLIPLATMLLLDTTTLPGSHP